MVKLIFKKIIWTGISGTLLYNTAWAYKWQLRRKVEKEELIAERKAKLSQKPLEVTVDQIPLFSLPKEEFDEKWLNRPLVVKGIFNHEQEMMVARTRHEERGFEIVTPLY